MFQERPFSITIDQLPQPQQQRMVAARAHLLDGNLSSGELPATLRGRLEEIWPNPVLLATTRHVKLDSLPQFTLGGIIFDTLAQEVRGQAKVFDIIWETHPKGMGTVYAGYPTAEGFKTTTLGKDLPNYSPWESITIAQGALETLLSPWSWIRLGDTVASEIAGTSKSQVDEAIDGLWSFYSLYAQGLTTVNYSLQTFSQDVEVRIGACVLPGLRVHLPETTPLSSSIFMPKIIATLEGIDKEIGLETLLQKAVDDRSAGNLFVGSQGKTLIRIGYSVKRSRFQLSEFDAQEPHVRLVDRKPIPKEEVLSWVRDRRVIPGGVPTFVALVGASTVVPVAHFGNEYGFAGPIINAWRNVGLTDGNGYIQVMPDNQDCWPPIRILGADGRPLRITFATMYLWQKLFGLDPVQIIRESIKRGEPLEMGELC